MPLSDHEQRLLEQMERALYQEDPKFASSLRTGRSGGIDRARIAIGSIGVLLGLVIVVVSVSIQMPAVGVVGFAMMVSGAFWAWQGTRGGDPVASDDTLTGPAPGPRRVNPKSKAPRQADFMNRMEQRWRKRREGNR